MITLLASLFHYAWSFALVITIIVFIHEFGHFWVARRCGVKVETFSIGFGRELLGRTDRHGTRWKISLWPLGGYVKMYGDAGAASTPDTASLDDMTPEQRAVSFHHKPLWAKTLIVAAGPAANFLLAIAVFTYFIFTVGLDSTEPVVGGVLPHTPAAAAGLKPGDRILRIDGETIHTFGDIPARLMINLQQPVKIDVARQSKEFSLVITPALHEEKDALGNAQKRPIIGINSQKLTYANVSLPQAVAVAAERTYGMCVTTVHVIGQIISGARGTEDVKGTLGIAKLSGDVTKQGDTIGETLRILFWFVALISVNLGFVNLLPIPMLDGGHLAFYCVEALRGRPLATKFQEYSYRAGLALIASLMVLTFYHDLKHIF